VTQPDQEHIDILTYVLEAFIPVLEPLILHRDNAYQFAKATLTVLAMTGWSLSYDPAKLTDTVDLAIEGLGKPPEGLPPRPPEVLDE
jgi:hypothetical protein